MGYLGSTMPISNEDLPRSAVKEGESPTWLATRLAFFETYSLDVAAGIVGASVFLQAFSATGSAPWSAFFCLGCAAVVVYNLDHLIDARGPAQPLSLRRRRHRERARSMKLLVVLATLAGSAVALTLPGRILVGGLLVLMYMGAYFTGVVLGVSGVPKRLGAAIGWTTAAAMPTIATCTSPVDPALPMAVAILAGLAWMNLQSYATADGPGEGCNTDKPGPVVRWSTISGVSVLIVAAACIDPSRMGPWFALAASGAIQAILPALPATSVHPVGEWGFALLALVRIAK